ncbi:hypothetical protein [Fusibacter ferrireducens]|uniref:Uncharacterized protein n=1 Tax=Fusibacter ferrireducens TaxID=2785058 RepID=A0ABR9ZRM4_9FIRM|nr:hypothetical protein [Fusibacter ferrireducens]MBF4693104.1 hypothetical protein [Fusibacter ferrireducens]
MEILAILLDNKDFRISQAISGDERYVSTLDKANNIITSERYSISKGTLQASAVVDLKAETITDKRTSMAASTRSVVASKYTQSTYSYEYTDDDPK